MQRFEMKLRVEFVTRRALERHGAARIVEIRVAELRFIRSLYMVHEQGRPIPSIIRSLRDHVLKTHVDAPVPEFT
jgi:hypothetical protein